MKPTWLALPFLSALFAAGLPAGRPEPPKSAPPAQDDLFKDVKLPKGDPIPDFVEPPWVPTNPDPSAQNKRGTDFGPALSFTVQLDKQMFVRRGLTVRLPRGHAILYDLDTLGVAATWRGGFLDISKTHYEDEKGQLPGRPGGAPVVWSLETPGWADASGSFADPRPQHVGPLPRDHLRYHGHFLHGYRVILSYTVHGRDVLEMPSVDNDAPPGFVSRILHVAAGKQPLKLLLARFRTDTLNVCMPASDPSFLAEIVELDKDQRVIAAVAGWAKGMQWTTNREHMVLSIPPRDKPLNLRVMFFQGHKEDVPNFEAYFRKKASPVTDLRHYVRGGPPRWKAPLVLRGRRGADDGPYAVDTLTLPSDNPWKSWIRPAAIDFFSDGRLAMSSLNGDVWLCDGIDKNLEKLTWRRFATGLYEPLGLKIVDDKLYVLGRDRITRLHDLNGDGEADYYQSFWAGGVVAPGYHAFCFDLQTDSKGNFYFLKSGRKVDDTPGHNALVKISGDGTRDEIVALGFRHPNGMGIGPNDEIVVGDNQGEFVPSSKVSLIRKGGYYGYGKLDPKYDRPLLWLPMKEDCSSGGQLWAPPNWGPLSGAMLHTSYGTCKLFYVLVQWDGLASRPNKDDSRPRMATAIPLPLDFDSGIMRGRVNPKDGQVYLSGLRGWGTTAKQDGCLHRVRFTGKPAHLVRGVKLVPKGIRLEFSGSLDADVAQDVKNYRVEVWNYIYSKNYGSPEMSVRNPKQKGHDRLTVQAARVEADGAAVVLDIPDLTPADQLHLAVNIRSREGEPIRADLFGTIHRLP